MADIIKCQRQLVVLDITYKGDGDPPALWDWASLTGEPGEFVTVKAPDAPVQKWYEDEEGNVI